MLSQTGERASATWRLTNGGLTFSSVIRHTPKPLAEVVNGDEPRPAPTDEMTWYIQLNNGLLSPY